MMNEEFPQNQNTSFLYDRKLHVEYSIEICNALLLKKACNMIDDKAYDPCSTQLIK